MRTPVTGRLGDITVASGFATLGPTATRLLSVLDGIVAEWGRSIGATSLTLPPVLSVADLATLDVYRNFPHLAWVASTLTPQGTGSGSAYHESVPQESLEPARMGLPSAVCYGVYLHHRGESLEKNIAHSVFGTCFRNEREYDGLRRLAAFRMREIVLIGSPVHVRSHLDHFDALILEFANRLGLAVHGEAATDPFFDADGPQARWQKLAPVKREYRIGDLAVASVNEHRKFFAERCDIRSAESGEFLSTGCVGLGLERWIHALTARYDDWDSLFDMVDRARTTAGDLAVRGLLKRGE